MTIEKRMRSSALPIATLLPPPHHHPPHHAPLHIRKLVDREGANAHQTQSLPEGGQTIGHVFERPVGQTHQTAGGRD